MTDDPPLTVDTAKLQAAVINAFGGAQRPSDRLSQVEADSDRRLTRFTWEEVHLANFRSDDGLLSEAELARSDFEQLTSRGVGYYAPAVLLILLTQGQPAAPLLKFLMNWLDPNCVGEVQVYGAFEHWNAAQVDVLVSFLNWTLTAFPEATNEKQHGKVRVYWEARRKQLASGMAEQSFASEDPLSSGEFEPREPSAVLFKAWVPQHRKHYKFDDLLPYYGADFISTLVHSWPAIFNHEQKTSSEKWFSAFKRTLLVVASAGESTPQSAVGQVYRHLRDCPRDPLNAALFRDALKSIVQKLEDLSDRSVTQSESRSARFQFIWALNGVLRRLARHRLLPSIEPLTTRLAKRRLKQAVPCLAELTPSGRTNVPVAPGADVCLDAHVAAMLDLNVVRLAALRACLEREFIAEYEAFKQGQAWLGRTDLPDQGVIDKALKLRIKNKACGDRDAGKRCERLVFRLKEKLHIPSDEELKAVLVRVFHERFGGAWTTADMPGSYRLLQGYFGRNEIVRHLEATARATTAAFGLLLIDTAFNVAPLSDLPLDPFVSKARHGKRRIATVTARKMRAKGKRVEGTLLGDGPIDGEEVDVSVREGEGRLSGIEIIYRYLEMTKPLRERARQQGRPEVAEKFWILGGGNSTNYGLVTNELVSMGIEWWPAFMKRNAGDSVIGGLPITRRNIRVTVLQIRAARNGFTHAIAQAVAEHARNGATTMSYLGSGWFRAQLSKQIRAFQHLFEAALAKGIEHAPALLGIDETEFARRVATAEDAGLDFRCPLHFEAKAVPYDPGPSCNPTAPCDACPTRRFIPSSETFRLLHLTHTALKRAEAVLIVQNPERWLAVWLRWRAFTEAYVRKIRRSPLKLQFERITKAVDEEVQRGDVALPIIA